MKRLLKLSAFVAIVSVVNAITLMVMIGPMMSGAGQAELRRLDLVLALVSL